MALIQVQKDGTGRCAVDHRAIDAVWEHEGEVFLLAGSRTFGVVQLSYDDLLRVMDQYERMDWPSRG